MDFIATSHCFRIMNLQRMKEKEKERGNDVKFIF